MTVSSCAATISRPVVQPSGGCSSRSRSIPRPAGSGVEVAAQRVGAGGELAIANREDRGAGFARVGSDHAVQLAGEAGGATDERGDVERFRQWR